MHCPGTALPAGGSAVPPLRRGLPRPSNRAVRESFTDAATAIVLPERRDGARYESYSAAMTELTGKRFTTAAPTGCRLPTCAASGGWRSVSVATSMVWTSVRRRHTSSPPCGWGCSPTTNSASGTRSVTRAIPRGDQPTWRSARSPFGTTAPHGKRRACCTGATRTRSATPEACTRRCPLVCSRPRARPRGTSATTSTCGGR
jgi:hypothetical protein